jgi:hypothetical protein
MTSGEPNADFILEVLDQCAASYAFPMLDNGYVYLAATRLSLHRSRTDWAMVFEVFGFMPSAGFPDTTIRTFASRLHNRNTPEQYVSYEAYERYLENNPYNEFRNVFPIDEGAWHHSENADSVVENAKEVIVRGRPLQLPSLEEYERHGIELEQPPRVLVFELCRLLAAVARDEVLATAEERRVSVPPDLVQILQLEEWHHPDLAGDERPSDSETFQQLAWVLATGDTALYRPSHHPNTHWRHWPDGGTL